MIPQEPKTTEDDAVSKLSLKSLATIVGSIVFLLGVAFTFDSRYVYAGEFKRKMTQVEIKLDYSNADSRIFYLEDRIVHLESLPTLTESQRVLLNKYQRDLEAQKALRRDLQAELRKHSN